MAGPEMAPQTALLYTRGPPAHHGPRARRGQAL